MPFNNTEINYKQIPATDWISRYMAFHDDVPRPFVIFPVSEDNSTNLINTLPPNIFETLSDINDEYGYQFDLAKKHTPKISPDLMLAGMTSDYLINGKNPFNIDPSRKLQTTLDLADLLLRCFHYAGPNGTPSQGFSLYQDYLADKVNPFGAFGNEVLNQIVNWRTRQRHFDILNLQIRSIHSSKDSVNFKKMSNYEKSVILYDMYDVLKRNGEDASWISDIADDPFDLVLYKMDSNSMANKNVRGGVVLDKEIPMINMNLGYLSEDNPEISSYSKKLRALLLHELFHIWQEKTPQWSHRLAKKDILTEVEAHKKQFLMERLLGISAGELRKYFESPYFNDDYRGRLLLDQGGYSTRGYRKY